MVGFDGRPQRFELGMATQGREKSWVRVVTLRVNGFSND
jgi:hypothetical protein